MIAFKQSLVSAFLKVNSSGPQQSAGVGSPTRDGVLLVLLLSAGLTDGNWRGVLETGWMKLAVNAKKRPKCKAIVA